MRFSLKIAAVAMLVAATPVAAQWKQDGKPLAEGSWSKADGDFGAQLFLTDKPDELFEAWERPARGVPLSEAKTARRGTPIVAVVFFTGCAPDANGLCQATVEYAAFLPDGKLYNEPSEGELWVDKRPPAQGQIQLGINSLGIVLEPEDPLGVYKLRATVVDQVAGKTLILERDFTAVEMDHASTQTDSK